MRHYRSERGQNLIEFALIAPFVLLFIGAIVVFGLAMFARSNVQSAVREGARTAATGASLDDVRSIAAGNASEHVDEEDVQWCFPGAAETRGDPGQRVVVFLREGGPQAEPGIPFTLAATGGIFSIFGVAEDADITVQLNPRATARIEVRPDEEQSELPGCPTGIP